MRLFDTHCHLDDERFNEDREQLIQALPEQGLVYCVTVGSDLDSSERSIALARQYGHVYAAAGVHPHEASKAPEDYLDRLRQMLGQSKVGILCIKVPDIGLGNFWTSKHPVADSV